MADKLAEALQQIVRQPSLLDRYGSADLKKIGKLLVSLVLATGNRAAVAEEAHAELLNQVYSLGERLAKSEEKTTELLGQVFLLDGEVVPPYSYLHKEEVLNVCRFTEFHLHEDEQGSTVCACGGTGDGTLHALYEFDWADFGRAQANENCRQMVTHLRRSFTPRQPKTLTQSEKKDD